MPKKNSQSLPVQGSVELFILNLVFRILRWIFNWLFNGVKPIIRSLLKILWPILRGCLIIIGLVAAIIVLQQLLARRTRLASPE